MGKKSASKVDAAPVAVVPQSGKKGKRGSENVIEKASAKKQKVERDDTVLAKQKAEKKQAKKAYNSSSEEDSDVSDSDSEPKVAAKKTTTLAKNATVVAKIPKEDTSSDSSESESDSDVSDEKPFAKNGSIAAKKTAVPSESSDSSESESDDDDAKKTAAAVKNVASKNAVSSDESDSDDESSEEETKTAAQPKKPENKPAESSESSDSDESSSDEEDVKPAPASPKGKVESSDEDSDDSSDSDEEPKAKKPKDAKTASAAAKGKVESSDKDTDDSSDEEPNANKPKPEAAKESESSDGSSDDESSDEEKAQKTPKKTDTDVEMIDAEKSAPTFQKTPKTPATPASTGSKTLFVGNLSFDVEESDVHEFFKDAGKIADVRFATDQEGQFKGFGHVEFEAADAAQKAMEFHEQLLRNRPVRLDIARERGASTSQSRGGRAEGVSAFISGFDAELGEEKIRSDFQQLFGSCGAITRISIPPDHETGAPKVKRKDEVHRDPGEDGDKVSSSDEDNDSKDTVKNTCRYSGKSDTSKLNDDGGSDIAMDDDVSDAEDNGNDLTSSSATESKFVAHTSHKLSEQQIEILMKRKWEYKWDMPAFESTTIKWTGTGENFVKEADVAASAPYGLKQKLYKHWLEVYNTNGGKTLESSKQISFFNLCSSYRDILHHRKKGFYQKGSDEDSSIMDSYIMHSLNHVFKSRDLVTKNNTKLAKNEETSNEELCLLDHGFTRPKVLILLPLASIALRLVRRLVHLTPSVNKVNVEYMDRFIKEFGVDADEDNDELEAKDVKAQKPSKPSDYQALFGGNNNDHFMVGVKFTRKSIRLYSDFYSSDMIIASPLGLITKIGEVEAKKGKDVDYLSSIEILVVDHADVIAMQNWSHVQTIVDHLNQLPKETRADIMRLRQWYVDGHARFYRQNIILSSYLSPDINALFNQHCLNFEGKLRLSCEYKGVLQKVVVQARQVYERFDSKTIVEADDARLDYFVKKVFPKIKDYIQGGVMLFISSYFEFVRVRNFLKSQNASFCLLSEYTSPSNISRARNWFIKGDEKIMLYTERAHFYHRYKIRGVKNLIIYSLPERKECYPEVLNMLEESQNMATTVLFSRFDQLRLERIVGTAASKRMTRSEKSLFIFA